MWNSDTEKILMERLRPLKYTSQNGVKEYLTRLKALGFDSWRWDICKRIFSWVFGIILILRHHTLSGRILGWKLQQQ